MIISQTAKQMPLNAASMRRSDVANGLSHISPTLGGRQVAKYRCGMTYSELEEFASVCRTSSLTASADEYDRGGYFDAKLVPHYYVTDYLGSNIAVIRSDGTLVQSATYYPYGEPHRDPSSSADIGIAGPDLPSAPTSNTATASTSSNPYLYGGKEYVRRDGLRGYIYGARMFVSSETRFNSMDRLCEKHPDQSPYLFCGGNPIRYGDDSGNDYHVKVNHEEQTITISADYYAYKRDVQSETAAIGFWNDLSGQYAMDGYTINFALSYHEVDPYIAPNGEELGQRKSITYAMKEDNVGNLYMSVPNIPNDKENTQGNRIKKTRKINDLGITRVLAYVYI